MANDPNLMPVYLLERRSRQHRIRHWQYVLLFETCAVGAAVVTMMAEVQNPASETRQAIEGTVGQIDVVSSAVSHAREKLQEAQQQLAVAREVVRKPDWSILLAALAWESQGRVMFDSLQMSGDSGSADSAEGYRLSITGNCDGQEQLTGFVQSLEATKLFTRVKITQTQSLPALEGASPRLGFTIDARIQEG